MMLERILFRVRRIAQQNSTFLSRHQLSIKYVIHIVLILYTHISIGFYIPKKNAITFDKKLPLLLYYLLWIYNLVYSSLQIRDGYPQAPFKPPFIKDTSSLTVNIFRLYKMTPLLWEMKVITDWIVTTTSLDLF